MYGLVTCSCLLFAIFGWGGQTAKQISYAVHARIDQSALTPSVGSAQSVALTRGAEE